MVRTGEIRRLAPAALGNLVLAAVYYGAAKIGLLEQVVIAGAVVTPLWPPTGIALSCLLLLGLRMWPGIAVGTFLVISTLTRPDLAGFGVVAGNTLAPVCACLMLRRVGFHTELDRLRDGVALVSLGAFAAMVISATLGSGTQVLTGALPAGDFWRTWASWWVGDAMGVLVITPLVLAFRTVRPFRDVPLYRWGEAAALLVTAVVVSLVVTRTSLSVLFLVFPVIVWAALRFQLIGAAPCVLLMSVFAISAATGRYGPFTGRSLLESMVNLQAFNASAALTALLLSAIVTEQNTIRRKIEQVCQELAEVVDRLAPGESRRRWPPER
ncbi:MULTISPECIES: MASE1 domain-containing protein [Streptomyces]|uniref:MASE1 domain-containing protein n=1 Tax=Streptomyces TaxID=1883 RepID=UPI0019655F6C|nr:MULTISPECIES: MASE1 domain-containing protein [Streptomyces]QRX97398.1 MASE1 domain-containing protein [Streptomyces noursei]UJB47023.1 MASE1 domain-containing protein [Streptomyces sp. A1-5]